MKDLHTDISPIFSLSVFRFSDLTRFFDIVHYADAKFGYTVNKKSVR